MKKVALLFAFLFLLSTNSSYGQQIDKDKHWIDTDLGAFVTTKATTGIGLRLGLNMSNNGWIGKMLLSTQYELLGTYWYHTIGALMGREFSGKRMTTQFSAGLGLVKLKGEAVVKNSRIKGTYEESALTATIPIELNIMFNSMERMGFTVWSNINPHAPMVGVSVRFLLIKSK